MKILQVIGTLDPAFGGPVEALQQRTRALFDLGHSSDAVTLDDPTAPWLHDLPGAVHALGPSRLGYRYNPRLVSWLRARGREYDAIIACGIWQYQSFAVRRAALSIGVPYFVFTHGALDPWFKKSYPLKHLKKWLYWPWGEYRVLRDAAGVLFTCEEEKILARESFSLYRANETVVDYGINDPLTPPKAKAAAAVVQAYPQLAGRRFIVFMSRIHAKKGCDLLIRAFAQLAEAHQSLALVMAGPDQMGLQAELDLLARELGVADRVVWTGMLTGAHKWNVLNAAELFALPSHSENFGVVVAEALACGIPVAISDKVNIWREIDSCGAGIVGADTFEGTLASLSKWLSSTPVQQDQMRERARECFERNFEIHAAARKLVEALNGRTNSASRVNIAAIS